MAVTVNTANLAAVTKSVIEKKMEQKVSIDASVKLVFVSKAEMQIGLPQHGNLNATTNYHPTWEVKHQATQSDEEGEVEGQNKRERWVKWFGSWGRKHLRMANFIEIGGKRNGPLEEKKK